MIRLLMAVFLLLLAPACGLETGNLFMFDGVEYEVTELIEYENGSIALMLSPIDAEDGGSTPQQKLENELFRSPVGVVTYEVGPKDDGTFDPDSWDH